MKFLFGDKKFLNAMFKLAIPIILQNLVFSSLNLVDGVMIGQLGESAVAAVGVANQVFFLVSLLFFGIGSGSAIFAAQYWGQRDTERIQSVLGLSLVMSISGALIFSLVAILFPVQVIPTTKRRSVIISPAGLLSSNRPLFRYERNHDAVEFDAINTGGIVCKCCCSRPYAVIEVRLHPVIRYSPMSS